MRATSSSLLGKSAMSITKSSMFMAICGSMAASLVVTSKRLSNIACRRLDLKSCSATMKSACEAVMALSVRPLAGSSWLTVSQDETPRSLVSRITFSWL